ncbi:MAG: hypothetical protein M3142_00205 [Bacteroidota bacterium]|nr:hypothetical protein [Bacteroidota bacterium]
MYSNLNKNGWNWLKRRLGFALFFLLVILVLGGIVQLLWNTILPKVLPVNKLNYGQALGLLVLCRILFGSFKFGSRMGSPFYRNYYGLRDKWINMSEEERAAFKEQWKRRCENRK